MQSARKAGGNAGISQAGGYRLLGRYLAELRGSRSRKEIGLDSRKEGAAGGCRPLSCARIAAIESGESAPSLEDLFLLGRVYGVPVGELLDRMRLERMPGPEVLEGEVIE